MVADHAPTTVIPTVRKYLTLAEIDQLIRTAKQGRYGARDALSILLAFRHGLRVSELCALTWAQVDFTSARLTVIRAKNGRGAPHPIAGDEMRALRQLQRTQRPGTRFVFVNERGAAISDDGFTKTMKRAAPDAGCPTCTRTCSGIRAVSRSPNAAATSAKFRTTLATQALATPVGYVALAPNRHDKIWS